MIWYQKTKPQGTALDMNGRRVYCTLKGDGGPTVLIEAALGAVSTKWWMIQDELAKTTRVLTYDRAGYGGLSVDDARLVETLWQELIRAHTGRLLLYLIRELAFLR